VCGGVAGESYLLLAIMISSRTIYHKIQNPSPRLL
jgi:hypothetical protein